MSDKTLTTLACLLLFCCCIPLLIHAEDRELAPLRADAIDIIKRFGGTLKPQLKKALQSGGPVAAIAVCSTQAPEIAKNLSLETGWEIKRVSLRPRNNRTATADDWERGVLQAFDDRYLKGETANQLAYAEVVDGWFRFMKAQAVEPLCLTCHGQNLDPTVKKALERHYPQDKATGYTLGQIRGAFSLKKKL